MLKRFLSRLRSTAALRDLTRQELIEALHRPGCALCHLAQQKTPRYIETLLDNAVIDVEQRDAWRHAKGFCNWHAWMAIDIPQSSSSLAILYDDVLHHELQHLAALTAAPLTGRWPQWRPGHRFAKRVRRWLQQRWQAQPCPICRLWREQEQLYMTAFLDDWHHATLSATFARSGGLCLPHVADLLSYGVNHRHLPAFVSAQQARLQALQTELREFIRKQDYRFIREAHGSEADAWRRVVALFVGIHGRQPPGQRPGNSHG